MLETAAVTGLSSHDAERPSLERCPIFNELSGDTLRSKSATGGVIYSPIIYPPSNFDDDMILAPNRFSRVSLVSGDNNSVDENFNDSGSLDTLSSSTSCSTVTGTLQSLLPCSYGLGISGLTRKDGSGSFEGLGIVSIKSSAWRHDDDELEILQQFRDGTIDPSSSSTTTYDGSENFDDPSSSSLLVGITGDTGISDVFLQETLLTFTQDPFHQLCHSISDCEDNNNNSWSSELGLCLGGDESALKKTTSISELLANDNKDDSQHSMMLNYGRRRRIPKIKFFFSYYLE